MAEESKSVTPFAAELIATAVRVDAQVHDLALCGSLDTVPPALAPCLHRTRSAPRAREFWLRMSPLAPSASASPRSVWRTSRRTAACTASFCSQPKVRPRSITVPTYPRIAWLAMARRALAWCGSGGGVCMAVSSVMWLWRDLHRCAHRPYACLCLQASASTSRAPSPSRKPCSTRPTMARPSWSC